MKNVAPISVSYLGLRILQGNAEHHGTYSPYYCRYPD